MEHRDECTMTQPPSGLGPNIVPEGWPDFSQKCSAYWAKINADQKQLLRVYGLGVVTARKSHHSQTGSITWRIPVPDELPRTAVWYIDGSALEADVPQVIAVGFAITLVDALDGKLLAFAYGVPPSWVNSSAAAEGWALYVVIASIPLISTRAGRVEYAGIVTDCKSLLHELARGKSRCVHHSRVMARLWELIFGVLDCDEQAPRSSDPVRGSEVDRPT